MSELTEYTNEELATLSIEEALILDSNSWCRYIKLASPCVAKEIQRFLKGEI